MSPASFRKRTTARTLTGADPITNRGQEILAWLTPMTDLTVVAVGQRPLLMLACSVNLVAQREVCLQLEREEERRAGEFGDVQVAGFVVALAGLARWARYDFPLIFSMMDPSTTRSRNAVASGGSPR